MNDFNKINEIDVSERKVKKITECEHDKCSKCNGSGKDKDGRNCIHMISCPCVKCSPQSM